MSWCLFIHRMPEKHLVQINNDRYLFPLRAFKKYKIKLHLETLQ